MAFVSLAVGITGILMLPYAKGMIFNMHSGRCMALICLVSFLIDVISSMFKKDAMNDLPVITAMGINLAASLINIVICII